MLIQATLDKMTALHLTAMAEAFQRQRGSPDWAELSFEDRVGMLIETEWSHREQRRLQQRLRAANLRYPASLEDIDWRAPRRGLDKAQVLSLGTCAWIQQHHNLILIGPTGIGKSWLASAFAERACRSGYAASCLRAPRLFHDLAVARGDGSYSRRLAQLAKLDLLGIDDWGLTPLSGPERHDLLEVLEDRSERASTLLTSQLPVKAWHEAIGEPTLADAICDRLLHKAHILELSGPSLRETQGKGQRVNPRSPPVHRAAHSIEKPSGDETDGSLNLTEGGEERTKS